MDTEKYVCHDCKCITEFNSGIEKHSCPLCSKEMQLLDEEESAKRKQYKTYSYIIPEGTETIESSAYERNHFITKVILPSTLKKMEKNCFCDCKSLKTIKILGFIKKYQALLSTDVYLLKKLNWQRALRK